MWNLYGKQYDLSSFLINHPGGSFVLERTKGLEDITPLFESYHAFSDIEKIRQTLNKYEIECSKSYTPPKQFNFDLYRKSKIVFPIVEASKRPHHGGFMSHLQHQFT